jgi:putative lipoprotein
MLSIVALLVLALACGGAPDEAAAPEPEPAAGPPVGTWDLVAIDGVPVADDADVTLTIEAGGRISGGSGCNRYTAAATFEGASIRVGPVAGTRMACPEPLMDLEVRYLGALEGVETYATENDALRLLDDAGATRLAFRRAADDDAAA